MQPLASFDDVFMLLCIVDVHIHAWSHQVDARCGTDCAFSGSVMQMPNWLGKALSLTPGAVWCAYEARVHCARVYNIYRSPSLSRCVWVNVAYDASDILLYVPQYWCWRSISGPITPATYSRTVITACTISTITVCDSNSLFEWKISRR